MARILITGASGLLGINLAMEAMRDHGIIGVDRGKLKSAPFPVVKKVKSSLLVVPLLIAPTPSLLLLAQQVWMLVRFTSSSPAPLRIKCSRVLPPLLPVVPQAVGIFPTPTSLLVVPVTSWLKCATSNLMKHLATRTSMATSWVALLAD